MPQGPNTPNPRSFDISTITAGHRLRLVVSSGNVQSAIVLIRIATTEPNRPDCIIGWSLHGTRIPGLSDPTQIRVTRHLVVRGRFVITTKEFQNPPLYTGPELREIYVDDGQVL